MKFYCKLKSLYFLKIIYSDEPTGRLALVFELMEMNLFEAIQDRKKFFPEKKVKKWMFSILKALDYMHRNGIFHRDIKPENILLLNDNVKLADLGSCKGIYNKPPFTEYISTRWYRAPECLLTDGYYNYKMDIWGLGCVYFELLTFTPLFPGDNEIDEVNKINKILGSPDDTLFEKLIQKSQRRNELNFEYQRGIGIQKFLSHVSPDCVDLINKMIEYDPEKRLTAQKCLNHIYFKDLVEQEAKLNKMNQMNPLLKMSFNDSLSFIKNDDSLQMINQNTKTIKVKKEKSNSNISIHGNVMQINTNENINIKIKNGQIFPEIKGINYNYNEDSKDEDSFNNSLNSKKHQDSYLRLPKIPQKNKFFGEGVEKFLNSNEFKKLKHNISNHSIDKGMNSIYTQYEKNPLINVNTKKSFKRLKKDYVSPYSKKNIENNKII